MKPQRLPRGFFWSLTILLKAGVPLRQALESLEKTEHRPSFKEALLRIRLRVEAGAPFAEALRKITACPDFILHLVSFGEETGNLVKNLDLSARYLEEIQTTKQKTVSALVYPALIFLFSIAGIITLVKFFLPNFLPIFTELHGKLPFSTRLLIFLNGALSSHWFFLILLGASIGFFTIKKRTNRFALSIPVLGKFLKLLFAGQLCRTIAAAHKAGLSIERALGHFVQSISNDRFRSFVLDLRLALVRGESLSDFLTGQTILPSYIGPMAAVAENSGKVSDLLSRCVTMVEEEIHDRLQRFTAMLEPTILAGLGLFAGFILTGIFSPLYKMVEALS